MIFGNTRFSSSTSGRVFSKMALAYTSSQCANNESCKVVQERILLKWTSQLLSRRCAARRIKARFGRVPPVAAVTPCAEAVGSELALSASFLDARVGLATNTKAPFEAEGGNALEAPRGECPPGHLIDPSVGGGAHGAHP